MKKFTKVKLTSILASTVVALLVLVGLNAASAASLGLKPNFELQTATATACQSATMNATLDATNHLDISGISASCVGQTLTVQTLTSAGVSQTGSATVTGTTLAYSTVVTNPSAVTGTYGFMNGWFVPTTWNYQTPAATPAYIPPTEPTVSGAPSWSVTAGAQACVTMTVTSTSATPVSWQITLVTADDPWNGDTNVGDYQVSYPYALVSNTIDASGNLYVYGTTSGSSTVSSTQSQNVKVCDYNTPAPGISPTAVYTTTVTSPASGSSYYVCKSWEESVTGAQFFVGWAVSLDLSDIKSEYIPGGGQLHVSTGGIVATLVSGNVYKISGNGYNTQSINNTTPVYFQLCWGS